MYRVIRPFFDLLDSNYYYGVGDTYPHAGKEVSEKRITALSTTANLQKRVLIKKVEENSTEVEKDGQTSSVSDVKKQPRKSKQRK